MPSILRRALALAICLLPATVAAERLPIRVFDTVNGLPHNQVRTIVRDSRGFLWFGTSDGLSRFDGYTFTNYSVEHGLPHRTVTGFLETRRGELWVATLGGLVHFRPGGAAGPLPPGSTSPPMFEVVLPRHADPRARAVTTLIEATDGTIWCGTRRGLFRLDQDGAEKRLQPVDTGIPDEFLEAGFVHALLEDQHGTIWTGTESGLYRRWPTGDSVRYTVSDGLPAHLIHDIFIDRAGHFWVAARGAGFFRLDVDGTRRRPRVVEHYDHRDGLPSAWVSKFWQGSDGGLWLATSRGLVEVQSPGGGRPRFRTFSRPHGIVHEELSSFAEDAGGNLWIGTLTAGTMRLARSGFVTYDTVDGIISGNEIFEDHTGQIFVKASVLTGPEKDSPSHRFSVQHFAGRFGRFDGERFEWFEPAEPFGMGWVLGNRTVRTRDGEWWLGGSGAVYRYPSLPAFRAIATARPIATYTMEDGLAAPQAYRLFADSRGDVWISTLSGAYGLSRWDRRTNMLVNMAATPGLPPLTAELPRAFGEDAAGSVWVGLDSGVARYRNGRFAFFSESSGLLSGQVRAIHLDRAGRLWLASALSGLMRVDAVAAERPSFVTISAPEGLSKGEVGAIAEDHYGRLYLATARGIDQYDPATGQVRHFTKDDGLAPGELLAAYCDRSGTLWFATQRGLSRFTPPPPERAPAPTILITGVRVAGRTQAVSAVGETRLTLPDLGTDDNQVEIEFVAPGGALGERLRYQVRVGDTSHEWSAPADARSVRLAGLSPGRYQIAVRAVNVDGVASPDPATLTFTILPPVWLRWWFVTGVLSAVAASVLGLHRYRLAKALELERVRTRIATDLHDDIGANLTRIAILSEVARQRAAQGESVPEGPLTSIATISRESVSSMSDIVWAINPERDTLADLVRKIRHHAEELFESREVTLRLDLPDDTYPVRLGIDIRRDLVLIVKEALNNAARHSMCTAVAVTLRVSGSTLRLEVTDNGVGFDPAREFEGHGLASLRRRANRLSAALEIHSGAGGTSLTLTVPCGTRVSVPTLTGR